MATSECGDDFCFRLGRFRSNIDGILVFRKRLKCSCSRIIIIIIAGLYVDTAATGAGLIADQAADRKTAKYADLRAQYVFQPVSVENLGPFSSSTLDFLRDLGRRISHISGDDRKVLFLFQRISVTIQRFNSVLLHDSFSIDRPDLLSLR